MEKDLVKIRGFKIDDAEVLAQLANNKKIWDNLRDCNPFPYYKSDAENYIGYCMGLNPATYFAIEYNTQLVGSIGLNLQSDVYRQSAEIGYWIGEPFWGKGIVKRAVDLMTDYGFNTLGLIRLYTGICDYNKASQRVLEKCGFEQEGIFKNAIVKNGKICNEIRFAKLKEALC